MNLNLNAPRLLAILLAASTGLPATAQDPYPARPIQMIIPFPAGAPVDILARSFAQALGRQLGQPLVAMNRDGGSTTIAMNASALIYSLSRQGQPRG